MKIYSGTKEESLKDIGKIMEEVTQKIRNVNQLKWHLILEIKNYNDKVSIMI